MTVAAGTCEEEEIDGAFPLWQRLVGEEVTILLSKRWRWRVIPITESLSQ